MKKAFYKQSEEFNFLDELRESGAVNMWGVRPQLMAEFELSKKQATKILSEYFNQE